VVYSSGFVGYIMVTVFGGSVRCDLYLRDMVLVSYRHKVPCSKSAVGAAFG
jgi:hypothetical protein